MEPFIQSIVATLLVSLISFVGIFILLTKVYSFKLLQTGLVSFAAGALIGDVFLHLLAEHVEEFGYESNSIIFIFVGILLMLVVEAYFHCSHDSSEELEEDHKLHILGKMNIVGDAVHNLLDGIAIGASFLISPAVGIASTLAIILHEIPQELADTSVLVYSGWRRKKILAINFITALTAVLGVFIVFFVEEVVAGAEMYLVPLAIGQFIYIALADLLPEIHKKTGVRKYILEILAFVLGLLIMYSLTHFE